MIRYILGSVLFVASLACADDLSAQYPANLQRRNDQWVVKSTLPSGSTAWFVNVQSSDLTASSSFQEVSIVSR